MPPVTPRTRMICGKPRPTMDMMVNKSSSPGKHPGIDKALHHQVEFPANESGSAADQDCDEHIQRRRGQTDSTERLLLEQPDEEIRQPAPSL